MDQPLLRVAVDLVDKVKDAIYNYNWMVRAIAELDEQLAEGVSGLTACYGSDAAMPKGKGKITNRVHADAAKRERDIRRLQRYRRNIDEINRAMEQMEDEKHLLILECMIDGWSNKKISLLLGIAEGTFYEWRREAIAELACKVYEGEV